MQCGNLEMQIWKYHTFGVSVRSNKKENTGLHADAPSQGGKPHLGITLCPRTDNSKGSMEMILYVSWTQKSRCVTSKTQMG